MSIVKFIGKIGKTACEFTLIGGFVAEVMLIYARFVAVAKSHPTRDCGGRRTIDEYQSNLLTAEELVVTMGLLWDL